MDCPATMRGIDRAFVINLDRRQDRYKIFRDSAPIGHLAERFPAIDGASLQADAELLHFFRGNDFSFRKAIMGCALSHYLVWDIIRERAPGKGGVAILEDDVWFSSRFLTLWNEQMSPQIPQDFDLLYLGGLVGPATNGTLRAWYEQNNGHPEIERRHYVDSQLNGAFAKPLKTQFGLYSYILSKSGAAKLCAVAEAKGMQRAVDWFVIDLWPELNVYVTTPPLCWSTWEEGSDIRTNFETLSLAQSTPATNFALER